MTVLARPLPPRVSGNRGPGGAGRGPGSGGNRPPGRIPPSGRPVWTPTPALPAPVVTVATRVPLPLQALALLGAFASGYAIGLALVQLWGLLAGKPRQASNLANYVDTGNLPGTGVWSYARSDKSVTSAVSCSNGSDASGSNNFGVIEGSFGSSTDKRKDVRFEATSVTQQLICGSPTEYSGGKLYPFRYTYTDASTGVVSSGWPVSLDAVHKQSSLRGTFTRASTLLWVKRDGVTVWQPSPAEVPQRIAPRFDEAPEIAAVPDLLPVLPVLPIAPDAEPVQVPGNPPTAPRPAAVPTGPRPMLPLPAPGARPTNNGQLLPLPEASPATTPGDVHFPWPGGPAVGPGGTRPDIVAIGQEVGRIEQKLALMPRPPADPSNPVDWGDLAATLLRIWEAIAASNAGGKYTLSSPCVLDEAEENRIVTEVPYAGGLTWLDVLSNKIDALAGLQQAAKDLRQPVCSGHRAKGDLVTVNFISPTKPPGSTSYLRKQMRYRDVAGVAEADHVTHWLPFQWQAGPAIVESRGAAWGVVQVWAADPEEGKRVVRHAAAIAGVDLTVKEHQWIHSTPRSARYGQSGTMAVERDMDGTPCVSKRVGSAGPPSWRGDP